jgi:hypothetical protein
MRAGHQPGAALRDRLCGLRPDLATAVAAGRKLDLGSSRLTAVVGIGPGEQGGFGLAVALDLDAPGLPYSQATRGNIEVMLTVGGAAAAREAA